ncbi:hypothetical protein I316_00458 [Kwoniella heveanensis BCC8398]|uniref:Uncharacterized protein n=1 Tax=Kwoniella heveanensis BCC8398 TaxID=1296120 RepID=A0A1B9H4N6_9TREE|nr:hypothetical protein I316_00458 [Kwoniella heveanensis BCC8398]
MPIPPRPIPTHSRHRHPQRARGSASPASASVSSSPSPASAALTRKSMTLANPSSLDWRAEITLLNELDRARSVPVGATRNVQMINKNQLLAVNDFKKRDVIGGADVTSKEGIDAGKGKMEVGLEGLIEDSQARGKREKRATTATTLGFDFIPNPSIVALPETDAETSASGHRAKAKSLLSTTKSTTSAAAAPVPMPIAVGGTRTLSPPLLSGTPGTPGLVPLQSHSQPPSEEEEEEEDDEEEEEWELLHIPSASQQPSHRRSENAEKGMDEGKGKYDNGDEVEDDVIVLGEMELEDEVERLIIEETTDRCRGRTAPEVKAQAKVVEPKRATYAAATATAAAAITAVPTM